VTAKDPLYFRSGFGLKKQILGTLDRDYRSELVQRVRETDYRFEIGPLVFRLAREFGFCYGVDRAVEYAYEAREKFPEKRLLITGQIIHNPHVNERLKAMGIGFLDGTFGEKLGLEDVTAEDVVLLPAFGVTAPAMDALRGRGAILVDTTCGSVLNVWKNVERYARLGLTAVVHGKYAHEETRATCSRARRNGEGHYLVVLDLEEARHVAGYIRGGGDPQAFLERFSRAVSPGFDPDRHLQRIGLANQTTMLSSESLEIAALLREALASRYGEEGFEDRFRSFDTICSATQERQDAIIELVREPLDLMLVIGGFNSSNTTHLAEIASKRCPTYHVEDAAGLLDAERVWHKPLGEKDPGESRGWIPAARPLTVGLTAGASTPDSEVGAVMIRVAGLLGLEIPAD
jgi:4-hydroxy-3-methylbut-2-enyl diphosphate reductase